MKPALVILAAGMGSRYGGLKQVDPVGPNGEIVLDYSLYDAKRAGFGKAVFVIRDELEETFHEKFDRRASADFKIEYAFQRLDDLPQPHTPPAQRSKPWGTGQALLAARHEVQEPFAVINADDFYGRSSYELLHDFLTRNPAADDRVHEYVMIGFRLANTLSPHGAVSRGICTLGEDGSLQDIEEHTEVELRPDGEVQGRDPAGIEKKLAPDSIVSMNMWGFTPLFFKRLDALFADFLEQHSEDDKTEFYLPAAIDWMIRSGECRVDVRKSTEEWFGVTYREDRDAAVRQILRRIEAGIYPKELHRQT